MVARIAPSPITSSVAIGDGLAHAPSPSTGNRSGQNGQRLDTVAEQTAQASPPAPPLPAPPGQAFAAAVIAGQLPPRPVTPEQLQQRLGAAWNPPSSPLRLMDRSA